MDKFPNIWYEFRFPNDQVAQGKHSQFLDEIRILSLAAIKHDPDILARLIVLGIPQADATSNYVIPNRNDPGLLDGLIEKWSEYKISDESRINDYSECALLFGDQRVFQNLKQE